MRRLTLKLKNSLKLSKENVVFVDETKVKFLLSKRPKVKILLKEEIAKLNIVHLCQTRRGVT